MGEIIKNIKKTVIHTHTHTNRADCVCLKKHYQVQILDGVSRIIVSMATDDFTQMRSGIIATTSV